jgi:hypothetical protein
MRIIVTHILDENLKRSIFDSNKNEQEFIAFCNGIAAENEDGNNVIKTVTEGVGYIHNYCDNLHIVTLPSKPY